MVKSGANTREFKLEAVRLVNGGQSASVTTKILGVPVQTLGNWVCLSGKGQLKGAGDKPLSAEQMELARLRTELARVKMERDILKKATAYFAGIAVKYAWIAGHKARWPITPTCEVLMVSASGYFEHWRRKNACKPSRPGVNKRVSDEALLVHIKSIHASP